MIPAWVRMGFIIGWLLVVSMLLWRVILVSNLVITLGAVLVVVCILMLSAYRSFTATAWHGIVVLWGLLLLAVLPLACVVYVFYQVAIVSTCALLLWWMLPRLLVSRRSWQRGGWSMLGMLVLVLSAVYGHARVNFVLTATARQRVVDRVVQRQTAHPDGAVVTDMHVLERVLLGRATAYRDEHTVVVYFDSYKGLMEAAFMVYTHRPNSQDLQNGTVEPLAQDWVFFRRGYAY